jgi:hypothetical protein
MQRIDIKNSFIHSTYSTPEKGNWENVRKTNLLIKSPLYAHAYLIILQITAVDKAQAPASLVSSADFPQV